jgi:hypothetical protein
MIAGAASKPAPARKAARREIAVRVIFFCVMVVLPILMNLNTA